MNTPKNPSMILIGLCVAGLLSGFVARRGTFATHAASAGDGNPQQGRVRVGMERAAAAAPDIASFPSPPSTDTAESLASLPDSELYARLASWLADASEPQIAAFWKDYSQKKDRSNDITDLILLNWTRLDPQAAVAGSSSDGRAWWAWACHDPAAALATATADAPDHVKSVAWGIGEFHPEWLRDHFDELNQQAKANALLGMAKWNDAKDPLAEMKFCLGIGQDISKGTFTALVRQDPWAALDWLKEHPKRDNSYDYSRQDPIQLLVTTLAESRPDDLERIAAQTPSGALKLKMEAALFDNLLKTNPIAAREQAEATQVPRIAAERFAAIGRGLVKTDPEAAFEIAKSLFDACPNALSMMSMVKYPRGMTSAPTRIPGVSEFMEGLVQQDPARILEMTSPLRNVEYGYSAFTTVSNQWATRDLTGYTEWVNQQTDPEIRDKGASVVSSSLQYRGNYREAVDWTLSIKDSPGDNKIRELLLNWKNTDPVGAAEWLETSDLTEDRKSKLRDTLK